MDKRVGIVLLNYNNHEDTIECINSLMNIVYSNFFVVIVDNASTNNSLKELKPYVTDSVFLIDSGKNRGFSYGNNIGIEFALSKEADYILLLNNDTVVDKLFLSELLSCAIQTNAGITTGRILYYQNSDIIWYDGGHISLKPIRATHIGIHDRANSDYNYKPVTFISGCCMLIELDVFRKLGVLPEEYFMYCEDLDYCINANLHGIKMVQNPKAIIYHKISATVGGEESVFSHKYMTKNHIQVIRKYIRSGDISNIELFFVHLYYIYKACRYLIKGNMKLFVLIIKNSLVK